MATNILALPIVTVEVETGTNEDWLDSIQYVAEDGVTPVSIEDIEFEMEVRHLVSDNAVVISASTADGRLIVGGTGNSYLLIHVDLEDMREVMPDAYVADIVASADGYSRRVAVIDPLTVIEGVTR